MGWRGSRTREGIFEADTGTALTAGYGDRSIMGGIRRKLFQMSVPGFVLVNIIVARLRNSRPCALRSHFDVQAWTAYLEAEEEVTSVYFGHGLTYYHYGKKDARDGLFHSTHSEYKSDHRTHQRGYAPVFHDVPGLILGRTSGPID